MIIIIFGIKFFPTTFTLIFFCFHFSGHLEPFCHLNNLPTPSYICGQEGDEKVPSIGTKAAKRSVVACNSDVGSNVLLHNQDFLKDSNFDVTTIFDTLFSGDVLLPSSLPNLPVSTRLSYRNKCFVHNFVGLCIWKHINNGNTWVKPNDLVEGKNPDKVIKFQHHAKVIRLLY